MHPGATAKIMLDRKEIGIIGKIHPSITKDEVYLAEFSLTKLMQKTKPIKYKEASKYPQIEKDAAWIFKNEITNANIEQVIKKAGGRLLESVEIFDIFREIEPGYKSMAYKMVFQDNTRTLSDEEVNETFKHIIDEVSKTLSARLRDK
jgi:phenylalanyl-tRNA synthetase beta chain